MLLWIEGFESLTLDAQTPPVGGGIQRRYETVLSATANLQEAAGLQVEKVFNTGALIGYDQEFITASLPSVDQDTFIVGFAMRPDQNLGIGASGGTGAGFAIHNDDGEQIKLEFVDYVPSNAKPGGTYYKLVIMRGATELARSDQAFRARNDEKAWVFFEWKVTIDNTVGAFEVRYRKVEEQSASIQTVTWDNPSSNVDTQNQGSTLGNRLAISWDVGPTTRRLVYDHAYLLDDTGAKNNDFLGNLLVERKRADGDGNSTDWVLAGSAADHQDAWDELMTIVDDDKRVTSDTPTDVSLVTLSNTAVIRDNIVGVAQHHHSRMESATGSLTLHHRWRRPAGPAETDGDNYLVDSTTPKSFADVREDDPNTATDWTIADLDALEVGVRNGG